LGWNINTGLQNKLYLLTRKVQLALGFTLGWNINTGLKNELYLLTREVVSGILYPYNLDKLTLKNWRYPQKSMFTATGGPTDIPLVVVG